jgi:Uma2 family endonuclease
MGVRTTISVEEYLHTSFPDLDKEYRDGELVERALPDYPHGRAQGMLCAFFLARRARLHFFPCIATRIKVRSERVIIPDVAVFHPTQPDLLPETPPLVAIEILSIDDRLSEVREKLEEYRAWGVPHVWLVDPRSRRFYTCDSGLTEVKSLEIQSLGINIQPADIFE